MKKFIAKCITPVLSIFFYLILIAGTYGRDSYPSLTPWAHGLAWTFAILGIVTGGTAVFISTILKKIWVKTIIGNKKSRKNVIDNFKSPRWYKYFLPSIPSLLVLYTYFYMSWNILFTVSVISFILYVVNYFTFSSLMRETVLKCQAIESDIIG